MDTPARHTYTGDGSTRVYRIPTQILGDDYVRIELDGVYLSDRSKWDIVNNSIVFIDAPSNLAVIDIQVATSQEALGLLGSISNSDIVAESIDNVNITGSNINSITTVADNIDSVNTTVSNIAIITTVATNISNVNLVGNNIDNVNTVADDLINVDTVATSITNVNTTAANITNVNTTATNITDVNTVANKIGSVELLASDLAGSCMIAVEDAGSITEAVTTGACDGTSSIEIVADNIDDVNTVAGISANVTTVAGISSNIATVVGISAEINTIANDAELITDIKAAEENATTAQLQAWISEAEQMTSNSYATEAEDTFVKVYTSNGDGTFTATDTTEYSALHWAAKSEASATQADIIADSLQFTGGVGTQGTMSWNADEETLDLVQNGATLQLGQELQVHCRNNTGSTIANGTVVMATGTLGASGRITVAPYTTSIKAKYILGITTEDIANGEDGKVTSFGKVRGLDTSSYSEGIPLYVANNGALTTTEPITELCEPIAFVINSSATVGTIMVRVPTFPILDMGTIA